MNWYISSMIFAWSWENCAISFTFTLLSFLFLFFRVLLHLRHSYEMWYLANTIHNILLLELYYIHPISTVEAPTAYSKYGPRSFLAYVADNLHTCMRLDIALADWASVHTWKRRFWRDFCVTKKSLAAPILKVDRHISIGFCASF